jgi:hypothetical protein
MLYNLLISYNFIGSIEDFIDSFAINVHWRLYDLQILYNCHILWRNLPILKDSFKTMVDKPIGNAAPRMHLLNWL